MHYKLSTTELIGLQAIQDFIELAEKLARQNRQGSIALKGNVLLMVDGEPVLIRNSSDTISNN